MSRFARSCSLGLLTYAAALLHAPHADAGVVVVDDGSLEPSPAQSGDQFGYSVSVEGDLAVVGAWAHSSLETNGGAAYVFRRDANVWGVGEMLTPGDPQDDHRFGIAVAVAGDEVLVGAHHDETIAWASGAVYAYRHDGTAWQEVQKITPDSGVFDGRFGISMAVSGTTAIFGSRAGAAYAYVYDGTAWQHQQTLTSTVGETERFGGKVAIDGDVAVLGAPTETTAAGEEGAAYVFVRSGAVWTESQRLVAWSGDAYDSFGDAVAVHGETLFVGSPYDDEGGTDAGAVYVFRFEGDSWVQDTKLIPAQIAAGDAFGSSVSLRGDLALVGSPFDDDSAAFAGSAILYQRMAGVWNERAKVVNPAGATDDNYGVSVATDGDTALIGAPGDDDVGLDTGMAFTFLLRLENGDPCAVQAECASGFCVDGVCCESACEGGAGISCSACSVATGATADGVCGFATSGTQCGDAVCSGSVEVQPASLCDGQGSCVDGTVAACDPGYVCREGACLDACTSEADCADGYRCDGAGACVQLLELGQACTEGSACESTYCVDDTCCNEVCAGGSCTSGTCELPKLDGGSDGGTSQPDGGTHSASGESDDDGCGCRVAGRAGPAGTGGVWSLLIAALFGLRRRRFR